MAIELAEAYVHIIPSAKGIKGSLSSIFGPEAAAAGKAGGATFSSAFGGMVAGATKMTAAAVGVAAAGVGALTSQAVQQYGRYEQLVGGVDKLYGSASDRLQKYAADAYKTSGMSANAYMESATSFSAALINSLGGDVDKAADMTDVAMRAMSDNVNVFGSDMASIETTFQSFAKQNYVMLDNLKLGYGGTKTEMQRLIADAAKMTDTQEKLGLTVDASSMSFANIVAAIQVMQTEMNIAGTTQKEAAHTIEGSLTSVKAAWENLVTGLADSDADFSGLVENLVNGLMGENGGGLIANMMPRIQIAMEGIGQLVAQMSPIIGQYLPALIDGLLPSLVSAVSALISALASALPSMIQTILTVIPGLFNSCMDILMQNLPILTEVALQAVVTLANGLATALPVMIPQIVDLVIEMADTIANNADLLIDSALALMIGLADGLSIAIPRLTERAPEIIFKLAGAIIQNLPQIITAGTNIILSLITGLIKGWTNLFKAGMDAVNKVGEGFKGVDVKQWGKDLVDNFIAGIKANWEKFKGAVKGLADTVHDYIGFSEPKKGPLSNFHTYAPDMVDLFAKGVKDSESVLTDQLSDSLAFPVDMGINATAQGGGGSTSIAPTINVYGADGQDVNELADIVMDKINTLVYKQGAVYA